MENSTESSMISESYLIRISKFGVFIALEPPSVFCNILLIYYLITDRTLRKLLYHHSILALLIVSLLTNLLDVPRMLQFLHTGLVIPSTKVNCLIWQWFDYMFYGHYNLLLLWASAERYLFIFYGNIFNTSKRRFYFHYFPLISIIVYLTTFYSVVILIMPCDRFDYSVVICGLPCYTSQLIISLYDNFLHNWIPLAINIILNIILSIRVFSRRQTCLQQNVQRKRHRKMAFQLLIISILHLSCIFPYAFVVFVQVVLNLPEFGLYIQNVYFYYLFWIFTLLQPFICISCLPEVINKLKKQFQRNFTVVPINTLQQ